jgi:hypothetical protein
VRDPDEIVEPDLIKYSKMICRDDIDRKISQIQKIYFDKIGTEYKNSK